MTFSTSTILCNHHLNQVPNIFIAPKDTLYSLSGCLAFCPPVPGISTCTVSIDLSALTFHTNGITRALLCLASSTERMFSGFIYAVACLHHTFILFSALRIPLYDGPHLAYPFFGFWMIFDNSELRTFKYLLESLVFSVFGELPLSVSR